MMSKQICQLGIRRCCIMHPFIKTRLCATRNTGCPCHTIGKKSLDNIQHVRMFHNSQTVCSKTDAEERVKEFVFQPKKALIVTKTSRYLYEKMLLKTNSEEALKKHVSISIL